MSGWRFQLPPVPVPTNPRLAVSRAAATPSAGTPPVISSFKASDRLLSPGDSSTLTWDVGDATSVKLTADTSPKAGAVGARSESGAIGKSTVDVTGKTSLELPHTQTTAHTLTATNASGSTTATVMVNVISITDALPSDTAVAAPSATLEEAAAFAWQEFIALNWPALAGNRDVPNGAAKFGTGGPVVWETFRHKLETFPGTGEAPHGGSNYNDPPQYIYSPGSVGSGYANLAPGAVPACDGSVGTSTPFINLDEQSEIGLDQMFAGHGPGSQFEGQQILFLAKSNKVEYDYVFGNGWYKSGAAPFDATISYLKANKSSPPPGSSDLVSFRNGTIEMKAAWRQLTAPEIASGRFYTAPVRYYRNQEPSQTYGGVTGDASRPCYVDAATGWGLVGLHIIQKTPTAPYFIFATFEQGDNILYPNGNPVEDVNGNFLDQNGNRVADIGTVIPQPFNPTITSRNATTANPPTAGSIQQLSPATANASPPANELYYVNTPGAPEPQGNVYVNRRVHSIPAAVIEANTEAHEAIAAYNQANGLASSPWSYYKLVNVQYKPIDKPVPGQDYTGDDAATYYQANIVVETDYNLQVFSGTFQANTDANNNPIPTLAGVPTAGLITDFDLSGNPAKNVFYGGNGYNMGGCMGCHGNAQVFGGGDFSFIITSVGKFNLAPDVGGPEQAPNLEKLRQLLPRP